MVKNSTGQCEVASNSTCTETICSHVCVNLSSNQKHCYCPLGMTLNGVNCRECSSLTYGHNCRLKCDCEESKSQRCDPRIGECVCKPGWTSSNCSEDINECLLASPVCGTNTFCVNTHGSFSCNETPGCGHELSSESGNINITAMAVTNPNDFFFCYWSITANSGKAITLKVQNIELESASDCSKGYFKLYNYPYSHSREEYCEKNVPQLFRQTSIKMLFHYLVKGNRIHPNINGQFLVSDCSWRYGDNCETACQCDRRYSSSCNSLNGSCTCQSGMIGSDCSLDYDECSTGSNSCPSGLTCKNTLQSYACPPFHYGPACSRRCPCVQERTSSCDNLYGICQCKPGWTGRDCSGDIDECLFVRNCTNNSECKNTPGSYECQCRQGYNYNNESKLCQLSQECPEPERSLCSHTCYLADGRPKCGCPEYLVLDDIGKLHCITPFYTPFGDVITFTENVESKKINFNTKVPFGENKTVSTAYITKSGVILFDNFQRIHQSCIENGNALKLVAALWSTYKDDVGTVMYNLIESCNFDDPQRMAPQKDILQRASESVKEMNKMHNFEATTVFIVTWLGMQLKKSAAQLAFQCVYISGYEKLLQNGQEIYSIPDLPGVVMFPVGSINGQEQKCERYLCKYSSLKFSKQYWSEIDELYKCPCSLDRLGLQWDLYERRDEMDCYAISLRAKTRLLPHNPRNKICCYKRPAVSYSIAELRSATFFQNSSNGGHLLLCDPWQSTNSWMEAKENIEAHQWCCSESSMCDKFYQIFPDLPCSYQVTFVTPSALGDPHITTLDGLTYSMNGWGEYILLDVPKENCMLQARTGRVESKSGQILNATVFIAFAAKQSKESSFQVELALTNTTITREMKNNKTTVKAIFSCGFAMEVQLGIKSLDILMQVDQVLKYKTKGLLGNYSDDIKDDFQLSNGTVISVNSTEREIFMSFVKDYEVSSSSTIFTYEAGESHKDYHHPEFVPLFLDEVDKNILNAAIEFCGAENLPCVYDLAATGDLNFARHTKDTKKETDSMITGLVNKPPEIKSLNSSSFVNYQWHVNKGRTAFLQVFAVDEDGDALSFILEGNLTNISVSSKGVIRFTPGSIPPSSLVIKVKDSKGGSSASVLIPFVYCSECNGQGSCDTELSPIIDGVEKFKCECDPAYTGEECESELDACSLSPCQLGRVCTDLSAQLDIDVNLVLQDFLLEMMTYINECDENTCAHICNNTFGSYECSCNAGFRLNLTNQKNCTDIDECAERTALCQQRCQNTKGSYTCACSDGYTIHSDGFQCILDIDKQTDCRKCQQTCLVNQNTITCGCNSGYKMDPNDVTKCIDIDECVEERVPCSQNCINTEGHYRCSCQVGFQLDVDNVTCTECKSPYYGHNCNSTCDCGISGNCHPSDGCKCQDGWTGIRCNEDFNECTVADACPLDQLCYNVVGSYHCSCHIGYTKINGNCTDIDECSDFQLGPLCSVGRHETCVNTVGSFMCQCIEGFHLTKFSACEDIDECSSGIDDCEQLCENTPGSFNCKCHPGF
ncbi:hypothetical protein Btru_045371 [Bulinus truncatus]|nr:hypothetical protein Btru_045371 [Bulinus truncatus]